MGTRMQKRMRLQSWTERTGDPHIDLLPGLYGEYEAFYRNYMGTMGGVGFAGTDSIG